MARTPSGPKPEAHLTEALQVQQLANAQIAAYHQRLADLRLRCLFTSAEPSGRARGCKRYGRIGVANTTVRYLSRGLNEDGQAGPRESDQVVLVVYGDNWALLRPEGRAALVDHFLEHIERDFHSGRWRLRDHTVQAFREEIERHGPWNASLREAFQAMPKQGDLFSDDAVDDSETEDGVLTEEDQRELEAVR